ncbi:hypothetical protein [Nocardia brevicatena]|uniref:hypothetical protein n=1 Tax=Nocardia brevicatena TaxID=37327 RepID=UPI000304169C|nr:hypothetical protein [Nocardia brevicatena]
MTRILTWAKEELKRLTRKETEAWGDTEESMTRLVREDVDEKVHLDQGGGREIEEAGEGLGTQGQGTGADRAPGARAQGTDAVELSVSGRQLHALAQSDNATREQLRKMLTEKRIKSNKAYEKSSRVREQMRNAILADDREAVRKIITKNKMSGEETDELLSSLDVDIPLNRVIKEPRYDGDFLNSLPNSIRHTETPTRSGTYVIPGLRTRVEVDVEKNTVEFSVNPYHHRPGWDAWEQRVTLPLQEQRFPWVAPSDIYGTQREAFRSQLATFGALAERSSTVYTHMTGELNLPGILTSESWGTTRLRGPDGLDGLNVEQASLGAPGDYAVAIRAAANGEPIKAPIKNVRGEDSFVSSYYVTPGSAHPIILFDESVTDLRHTIPNPGGIGIVDRTRFDDPSLIGIWVPPTFRENLLHWISGWPEAEVTRLFRGRSPESILISSAEHLLELPRG